MGSDKKISIKESLGPSAALNPIGTGGAALSYHGGMGFPVSSDRFNVD